MRKLLAISLLVIIFTLIILFSQGFFNLSKPSTKNLIENAGKTLGLLTNENPEPEPDSQIIGVGGQVDLSEGVQVSKVIDGDTIEVEGGMKVRYIGIDTPETSHPTKGLQCFGKQATEKNRQLVEGKKSNIRKRYFRD